MNNLLKYKKCNTPYKTFMNEFEVLFDRLMKYVHDLLYKKNIWYKYVDLIMYDDKSDLATYHFNLYHETDKGKLTLITKDHITKI